MPVPKDLLQFQFTEKDYDIVKSHLEEWKGAKWDQQTPIAQQVYQEIKALDVHITKEVQKLKKQVSTKPSSPLTDTD
jgi:hypothetical protein